MTKAVKSVDWKKVAAGAATIAGGVAFTVLTGGVGAIGVGLASKVGLGAVIGAVTGGLQNMATGGSFVQGAAAGAISGAVTVGLSSVGLAGIGQETAKIGVKMAVNAGAGAIGSIAGSVYSGDDLDTTLEKARQAAVIQATVGTAFSELGVAAKSGETIVDSVADGMIDYMAGVATMGTGSIIDVVKGEMKNDKF